MYLSRGIFAAAASVAIVPYSLRGICNVTVFMFCYLLSGVSLAQFCAVVKNFLRIFAYFILFFCVTLRVYMSFFLEFAHFLRILRFTNCAFLRTMRAYAKRQNTSVAY